MKRLLLISSILFTLAAYGQVKIAFSGIEESLLKELKPLEQSKDSALVIKEARRIENKLISNGYLSANIDNILINDSIANIHFFVGNLYKWGVVRPGNAEEEALIKSGYRNKIIEKKTISPQGIAKIHKSFITHYENRGYPFASSRLTNLQFDDSVSISAELQIEKGPLVKIDSVVILGTAKISKTYLTNYIGISEGDLYNQEKLNTIDNRLKELSFVQPFKNAQVGFTKEYTKLYIYINHQNASKFNGILGILPDNETGEVTITGDAKIALKNAFKKGEFISLNWRKLQDLTQDLDATVNYPFVFKSPMGIDAKLKIFKKDTSYLELNQRLGIQYLFSGGNYLMVFFDNYSSSLINGSKYAASTVLPDFADVKFRQYGISAQKLKLDYRINPRQGYEISFTGSVGTKVIAKNPALNDVLYDDLDLTSLQFKLQSTLGYYIPIAKRSTVYLKFNGGYILNENVFMNELFRIGGLKTLRGFDEEGMNASHFGIATIEYRFLLERNSNLYVFGDMAYYERTVQDIHFSDRPYGFGAGISFQTRPGIFSLGYALGSEMNNPIQFRSAKIHFGFLNYF